MEAYLKAIRSLPKGNKEEERELWERHWNGDPDARNRLIENHLWLVVKISRRYYENFLGRDDLAQEGVFGLMRAIDMWEPGRGAAFSTYAWSRIRGTISRAILMKSPLIRPPGYRDPVIPTISIFTPLHSIKPDGDVDGGVEDKLADEKVPGLDEAAEEKDAAGILDDVLRTLPTKQEVVLRRHYGIGTHERTLEEVGREFGFSRQYIHQIEKKALGRLRKNKELRALAGCL